jgi:hypothetical protein
MDDLDYASAFICHSGNSSRPGYWLSFARSSSHYILPVPTLCSDVPHLSSSTLKLKEAASSKILVPVYQITGHHISEDHSFNNQWADTQMVSAYLLFCFVIRYNIFDCP